MCLNHPDLVHKHTITDIAMCVGCLCTSSGWFKHIEPHRTYTNQCASALHTLM